MTKVETNETKIIQVKMNLLFNLYIILIYFTLPHFETIRERVLASNVEPTTSGDSMTDDDIKKLYKELAKERLFNFKGKPSDETLKNPNSKLYVPSAILKEYMKYREVVRDVVPDDQNFYGKIDIDEVNELRDNHWSKESNGILVDMGQPDQSLERERLIYDREKKHVAQLQLSSK